MPATAAPARPASLAISMAWSAKVWAFSAALRAASAAISAWRAASSTVNCAIWCSPSGSGFHGGMDDLPVARYGAAGDDLVVPVDAHAAILDDEIEEVLQVSGVERRGVASEAGRGVGQPDDRHTIMDHDVARSRQRAIAAALDREIDDDRAGLHGLDHLLGHEHRCRAAGDQGGGDDHVLALDVLRHQGGLALLILARQLAGVAGGRRSIGETFDEDEFRPEALNLLAGGGPHVGGRHDRAETAGGSDGLEPGDAGTHDEDTGGRNGTGGGHHHRKGAGEMRRGIDDR